MTPKARLQRWQTRLTGDGRRGVAVHARDLILAGVDVVAKKDRLPRALERSGVVDDRCAIPLGSRLGLLAKHDRRRQEGGENPQHHDRG